LEVARWAGHQRRPGFFNSTTLRSQGDLALFRELTGIAQQIEKNLLEREGARDCKQRRPARMARRFSLVDMA
jgi:hypothetical protein